MDKQGRATVMLLLSRLAVHYYRPDFTENQAKLLVSDMVEDLAEYSVHEVEASIRDYRRGENKFFPASGQLRKLIADGRRGRHLDSKISTKPLPKETRPIMWWLLPEQHWKPHWRESEIPLDHVRNYQARKDRKATA